jgi:hypothetical protein
MSLTTCFFAACSATKGSGGVEGVEAPKMDFTEKGTIYLRGKPVWRSMKDVMEAVDVPHGRAEVQGNTLDLGGSRLSGWKMKRPANSQDENADALRVRIDGFTLKNGVVDGIPGGIIVSANNNTFENLTFTNIGEDALSTIKDVSRGTVVRKCRFYNTSRGDKSLQLNDGRDTLTDSNYFTGGVTAMRLVESTSRYRGQKASVCNNVFEKVRTALNVDGSTIVRLSGNVFKFVYERYKVGADARLVGGDK